MFAPAGHYDSVFRSWVAAEIESLDPQRDACRIVHLSSCYDFPFDNTRALEFALFRTYAVPSISSLLDRTGEFGCRAQKRYDDTDLILSEIVVNGYDSPRGKAALKRMNQIHGRFEISNEDYLYVLSTFIFEPIRWNEAYGWRPMGTNERLGMYHFWCEVGRRMAIQDIPHTFDRFEAYNRDYEDKYFQLCPSNQRVGEATVRLFLSWGPKWSRGLGRQLIFAMMDAPLRAAFGFPAAPRWLERLTRLAMAMRRVVLPLFPRRTEPVFRTKISRAPYPYGYEIEDLGPPPAGCRGPKFDGGL